MIELRIKTFYDTDTDEQLEFEITRYPVGEIGVKVIPPDIDQHVFDNCSFFIDLYFESLDELFIVAMIKDAVQRLTNYSKYVEYNLNIPYFPFGRQDRVTEVGEAFSLMVFSNYVNSLDFDRVIISDPHSYVTPALINNCIIDNSTHEKLLYRYIMDRNIKFFISPDQGASKKTQELGIKYGLPVVECSKDRDPATGKLSGFRVTNKDVFELIPAGDGLIVDDICDGGGTFLGIADVVKGYVDYPLDLHLYVTFGCFTRGIDILFTKFKTVGCTYNMVKTGD